MFANLVDCGFKEYPFDMKNLKFLIDNMLNLSDSFFRFSKLRQQTWNDVLNFIIKSFFGAPLY